jgi:CDP-glucose 4,6-dehydratase
VGGGLRVLEGVGVSAVWRDRRVLVTGVTGFKGSWLGLWLRQLGANVVGYSLPPPTSPSLFDLAGVRRSVPWIEADVRDAARLRAAVKEHAPEIVFHLAAQPLVRASYESPVETYETNVLGTVNLLEALRHAEAVKAVVVVTSDKCYENRESLNAYREGDPLGGHDPYSSSKACQEIVTAGYLRSFFEARHVGVATVRAGNVIGGGDWARDRIVPDAVTALATGQSVPVRNPVSVRPWQHVLDPLAGYIEVAERLVADPAHFSEPYNFGPSQEGVRTVADLVTSICSLWGEGGDVVGKWHSTGTRASSELAPPHEARLLTLDSSKARDKLGWRPRLAFDEAIAWTTRWYKAHSAGEEMRSRTLEQIHLYVERQVGA